LTNHFDSQPAAKPVVGILAGTGREGIGLALRWARAGEIVLIGSRDRQRAKDCAREIRQKAGPMAKIEGLENVDVVAAAGIVVVTVPFDGHAGLLKKLKPAFRPGTIVIDTTVQLAARVGVREKRTLGVWEGSAAQKAAEILGKVVAIAAAFQNISAALLNQDGPVDCDVIVCSDEEKARQAASRLAEEIPGVRAINGGGLENARTLEQLTALLIAINRRYRVHGAGLRLTGLPIAQGTS